MPLHTLVQDVEQLRQENWKSRATIAALREENKRLRQIILDVKTQQQSIPQNCMAAEGDDVI